VGLGGRCYSKLSFAGHSVKRSKCTLPVGMIQLCQPGAAGTVNWKQENLTLKESLSYD